MSEDKFAAYRAALNDSEHPQHEAAWLLFQDFTHFNPEFAAKRLKPEQSLEFVLQIVEDTDLRYQGSIGNGFATVNAVKLIGAWGLAEHAPKLVQIVEQHDFQDLISSAALIGLYKMGDAGFEAVWQYAESVGEDRYGVAANMLSAMRWNKPQAFDWIVEHFPTPQQSDYMDVSFFAEALIAIDRKRGEAFLEQALKKGGYNAADKKDIREAIEEFKKP